MDESRFNADDGQGGGDAGADIQRRIRQEPGRMKQTNIEICGYEMH